MLGSIVLTIVLAHPAMAWSIQTPPPPAQQPPAIAQTTPERPWPPAGVLRLADGVSAPRLVKEPKPVYTDSAKRARIQGRIGLEAVVEADGTVGEVKVVRSLDQVNGLDDRAVETLKKWRFAPGKKDGIAVPVLVEIEMTFTLR